MDGKLNRYKRVDPMPPVHQGVINETGIYAQLKPAP